MLGVILLTEYHASFIRCTCMQVHASDIALQ